MKVKSLDQITTKWASRAQAAGQAYSDGVKNPRNSWASQTEQAADNWSQGVQAAVSDGRFARGVTAAGDAAWQNGSINKGVNRYGPGVAAATSKFSAGFQKFAQALTNATLPKKFPKGDPNNMLRSQFVGTLLRNVKLGKA